jgi:hypothetical protein
MADYSETERLKASSFARARLKLQLEVAGPLHDIEVYLGDDQTSALIFAPDGKGHWAVAVFELFEPTTEDAFDPTPWIEAIEGTHSESTAG